MFLKADIPDLSPSTAKAEPVDADVQGRLPKFCTEV